MSLQMSKMPHRHAPQLFLLFLFLLLPQTSHAAAFPKPRSKAFWHKFCGFFCPYQVSCDSNVYLSRQQQLDLLNSQEFLDILELFPQILLENEKLQHTTLVRLEDHQRDLILLHYKDFFHPRETLPLARNKIVSQLTKEQEGFGGIPVAEPPPQRNAQSNEIHLTADQIQQLLQKNSGSSNNQEHQDKQTVEDGKLGTPNWNEAERFIRDYVDKQRMEQSSLEHLKNEEHENGASSYAKQGKTDKGKSRNRDKAVALNINELQDEGSHLNVEQILKELEKMGHSLDLNNLGSDKNQDLGDSPEAKSVPEPHRTTVDDPAVLLNREQNKVKETSISKNDDCKTSKKNEESNTSNVNRISDKRSKNSKEPYSDSHDAKTIEDYFYRHQRNLPSKQQLSQALAHLHSVPSSYRSTQSERTGNKKTLAESDTRRRTHRHHPDGFVHEPGGRDGDTSGSPRVAKRHSRKKREVLRIQVCPVVESWSNMILAETENGSLVQVAQFPENNLEQWFLEERCLYEESKIIRGVTCEIRERLVDAVVIPVVNPTQPIQMTKIKIQCCMSMFNVDLGF